MQSAIRQVRRSRSQYQVTIESVTLFRHRETRILPDGKILLKNTETRKAVKRAFETTKGSGYKLVKREVSHRCVEYSTMKANYELKRLKICQQIRPVFDNKAPLIPIRTSSVQERHQADLVVMNKYPVHRGNREYQYVLSILDCFSRYLWLRPLETNTSSSVVREIKKIYNSEGHPRIFQTDQ